VTTFVELIVGVHDALDAASLPHAFGGALALGYVAVPRGTVDIDVNVFVEPAEVGRVATAVAPLGFDRGEPSADTAAFGGVRFVHASEPFPLDVFPSLDDRYGEVERRLVRHRFGSGHDVLPFLSAEDLCVFKLSFGRPQDWVDLAAIALARPDLEVDTVEDLLVGLRGPTMYPRVARLRGYLRTT
jgi:hypothetical protein